MIPAWAYLDQRDRGAMNIVVAFLATRLEERATLNWALRLDRQQTVERIGVTHILDGPAGLVLKEPWSTAWRLLEESWSSPPPRTPAVTECLLRAKTTAGWRSIREDRRRHHQPCSASAKSGATE
jgi:hypothetical protein